MTRVFVAPCLTDPAATLAALDGLAAAGLVPICRPDAEWVVHCTAFLKLPGSVSDGAELYAWRLGLPICSDLAEVLKRCPSSPPSCTC